MFVCVCVHVVLGVELNVSHVLGKYSTIELYLQPFLYFFFIFEIGSH